MRPAYRLPPRAQQPQRAERRALAAGCRCAERRAMHGRRRQRRRFDGGAAGSQSDRSRHRGRAGGGSPEAPGGACVRVGDRGGSRRRIEGRYDVLRRRGSSHRSSPAGFTEANTALIQFEYNRLWREGGKTLGGVLRSLTSAGYAVYVLRPRGLEPYRYEPFGEFLSYSNFVALSPSSKIFDRRWAA